MAPRNKKKREARRPVGKSLREYGRGVAGGLIFSLPLLYTMEVWWSGFIAHPLRLLAYVVATFLLLLGYNRYAGLRRDASMLEVAIDSVEEMGLGFALSALILWLLGRVTFGMPSNEIIGQIVIEAMTFAIGVSVGTAQLGVAGEDDDADEGMGNDEQDGDAGDGGEDSGKTGSSRDDSTEGAPHLRGQLVLSLCGAVLFAANVAPTEEIVMIAAEISWLRVLGLALLSLTFGALILYYSEFTGSQKHVRFDRHHDVLVGTVITYAVALAASASILLFFGRFDGQALAMCIAQTVVLGVAGMLGASAGRLLLQ